MPKAEVDKPIKKILLSGYYGFGNAGDEAVLAALCQIMRDTWGGRWQLDIVALSAQPEQTAAAYNIRGINRWDKRALRRELRTAHLFCSGGGSLLQDVTSVRSVWYYVSLLRLAQKMGVPTMVLAQGLGPLHTALGRWLACRALKGCSLLSWRDLNSQELAARLLPAYPVANNRLVCDPVLFWQPPASEPPAPPTEGVKTVGLALRPWRQLPVAQAAITLARLIQGAGWRVALLPYHQGEDEELAAQINAQLATPAAVWPCAEPRQAWAAVGRVDLLLGMRLHSLIMAAAQGVPAVAVSYDPKVAAFAGAAGIPLAADNNGKTLWRQLRALPEKPLVYPLGQLRSGWQPLLAAMERLLEQ